MQNNNDVLAKNIAYIAIVFLLNPLIGILLSVSLAISGKKTKLCLPLIILCSLYMGAISSTKVPWGDVIAYLDAFKNVPALGFEGSMRIWVDSGEIHEPCYTLLYYSLYYLLFGKQFLFLAVVTSLSYLFTFLAAYRLSKEYKTPNYILVAGVLTLTFFTQYFTITGHLIRQMLATSLFFFVLTYKNHKNWIYAIGCLISFNIHNSLILLILLSLIPQLNRLMNYKTIAIAFVGTVAFAALFSTIAETLLGSLSAGGDVASTLGRAVEMEGKSEGDANMVLAVLVSAPIVVVGILLSVLNREYTKPIVINLGIVWCLIVLMLTNAPFLQSRFFFVIYYFIVFVLFYLFTPNTRWSKAYCFIIPIAMMIRFYMTLNTGAFEFCSSQEALILPYPFLLNFN